MLPGRTRCLHAKCATAAFRTRLGLGEGGRSLRNPVREPDAETAGRRDCSWEPEASTLRGDLVEGLADLKAIASGLLLPEIGLCASKRTD